MKNRNFSDWIVAIAVIACSAVLFTALALALTGTMLGKPARSLLVNFSDVTGISLGGQVKLGGAAAGRISGIRILSPEERLASKDPANTVQVALALTAAVPALPTDITVTVAADTLLSDKFLLLSGGTAGGEVLDDGAVVQGIRPVSIDELARTLDGTLVGLRGMMGGTQTNSSDILGQVRGLLDNTDSLLADTRGLIVEARPVVQDAQILITQTKGVVGNADTLVAQAGGVFKDAGTLISDNSQPFTRTIANLEKAAGTFDRLAINGNNLIVSNEKKLNGIIAEFRVTSQNLKVTSTYAEILTRGLARRPSSLVWGGRTEVPSREEILSSAGPAR